MARQNTFTIIPPAPRFDADTATPTRPMTSKQVRKAYKAATKTPTMTRAERIKWEREEQDRIRKEFEKEKAAAKARAAREKKKEKETQQREEKRRNGLPLVKVRPSQDTIARFVRGNGSEKKRDAEGVVVTVTTEVPLNEPEQQQDADANALAADATVLGSILESEEGIDEDKITEHNTIHKSPPPNIDDNAAEHNIGLNDGQAPIYNEKEHGKNTQQDMGIISEDYDVDLSLEEPIDQAAFDAALDLVPAAELDELHDIRQPADKIKDQVEQPAEEFIDLMPSQDLLDEEINTDMLEELDELLNKRKTPVKPAPVRVSSSRKYSSETTPTKAILRKEPQNIAEHRLASQRRETRKSPAQMLSSPDQPRHAPPMGTQAILVNFDDFFPTSSQQLRELEDEQEPSHRSPAPQPPIQNIQEGMTPNTNIHPQSGSRHPAVTEPDKEIDELELEFGSFPSTAHYSLLECSMPPQPPRQTPQEHTTSTPDAAPQPPPPSRFFTSSGSREQLSLALQRSRRSAALEQMQEKERQRQEAGLVMRQSKQEGDEAAPQRPASSSPARPCCSVAQGSSVVVAPGRGKVDKENVPPEMWCSQETEYGGDWVEDAAWDLALC